MDQKFHTFSSATGQKATTHKFSPPRYPGGIEAIFPQKTNTFPDRRKEVITWRYFALRKPATTR